MPPDSRLRYIRIRNFAIALGAEPSRRAPDFVRFCSMCPWRVMSVLALDRPGGQVPQDHGVFVIRQLPVHEELRMGP